MKSKSPYIRNRDEITQSMSSIAQEHFRHLSKREQEYYLTKSGHESQMIVDGQSFAGQQITEWKTKTASDMARRRKILEIQAKTLEKMLIGTAKGAVGLSSTTTSSDDQQLENESVNITSSTISRELSGINKLSTNKNIFRTIHNTAGKVGASTNTTTTAASTTSSAASAKTSAETAKSLGKSSFIKKFQIKSLLSKDSKAASANAVQKSAKSVAQVLKSLGKAIAGAIAKPAVLIVGGVVIVFSALIAIIAAVVGSASAAEDLSSTNLYIAKVSEQTESYRELVADACEKYGIPEYVELTLAVIEQESSGTPPDVMQAEQSYYNTKPPIDSVEESIDCGVHELKDCLDKADVINPADITRISLALQGYNYGNGYISWAIKKDGGYTAENAKEFSENMKSKFGYQIYGDPDYVPHVLRYYVPSSDGGVANQDAAKILSELMENNVADGKTWSTIAKGASLIGFTTYSMKNRQDDGRDRPTVLDCSSFTAWCFHKAGYTDVPYASTTTTFKDSSNFKTISASELRVGDIGLKSSTAGSGGANHIGIYCGKLRDGTKVWMHCTSGSSTSLTGNRSGAMFGAYTKFTYFRRYTG